MTMAVQTPPPQSSGPALPEIRDIAPPVDVFPWPPWAVGLVLGFVLILLVVVGWFIVRAIRRRPPLALSPREVAVTELEALRAEVMHLDPYEFSVRVSDVLRTYIERQFGLRAKEQTSPEFLASLAGATQFTAEDRGLLERFLEKCDLIKFARIDATSEDSAALLASAIAFVKGAKA